MCKRESRRDGRVGGALEEKKRTNPALFFNTIKLLSWQQATVSDRNVKTWILGLEDVSAPLPPPLQGGRRGDHNPSSTLVPFRFWMVTLRMEGWDTS